MTGPDMQDRTGTCEHRSGTKHRKAEKSSQTRTNSLTYAHAKAHTQSSAYTRTQVFGTQAEAPAAVVRDTNALPDCPFTLTELLTAHVEQVQVTKFIHAVISRVVPEQFYGSRHNKRLIFDGIGQFCRLRRFETVAVHNVLHDSRHALDVQSQYDRFRFHQDLWYEPCEGPRRYETLEYTRYRRPSTGEGQNRPKTQSHETRRRMVGQFLVFLYECLVIPLIQTHFYVTETSTGRQRAHFYRKNVWQLIHTHGLRAMNNMLQPIAA
ncbi:hypothetical protein SARC_13786, partial [Sphaeroforma arctica JP610]